MTEVKSSWFYCDALEDLTLVNFSLVNVLSDEGLYHGYSDSESLFLNLNIWGDRLQHSLWLALEGLQKPLLPPLCKDVLVSCLKFHDL